MPTQLKTKTSDPLINLALDTIDKKKQALVFVNTKRSAERVGEDISKKTGMKSPELERLADTVLKAASKPTKQCERLARCVRGGTAFHHSGLHSRQREAIEDAFRKGTIKIISCTPTLAAGIDLPAFRAIIRDVKRFGPRGMAFIPVLEFLQMAGRAGRPKYDKVGECIVVTQTEPAKEHVVEHYLNGFPEDIYSKLAVEPVLRTYVLSLINSRIVRSHDQLIDFFEQTFWAHQYKDVERMERIIDKVLDLLIDWGFLQELNDGYRATMIGKRVAELYIDPLTAHKMLTALEKGTKISLRPISFLQLACNTLEMRPPLRVKQKEYDKIQEKCALFEPYLMQNEPSMFDAEYDDWLNSIKTALMLKGWIEEHDEQWILDEYDCRPGEMRVKVDRADWLLYAAHELARLMNYKELLREITKVRLRLKYGVKDELLPLVRLRNIGRARARKLFRNGIKNTGDIRKASLERLIGLVGKAVSKSLKEQVGQKADNTLTDLPK